MFEIYWYIFLYIDTQNHTELISRFFVSVVVLEILNFLGTRESSNFPATRTFRTSSTSWTEPSWTAGRFTSWTTARGAAAADAVAPGPVPVPAHGPDPDPDRVLVLVLRGRALDPGHAVANATSPVRGNGPAAAQIPTRRRKKLEKTAVSLCIKVKNVIQH
jgi:hypothetical protein